MADLLLLVALFAVAFVGAALGTFWAIWWFASTIEERLTAALRNDERKAGS